MQDTPTDSPVAKPFFNQSLNTFPKLAIIDSTAAFAERARRLQRGSIRLIFCDLLHIAVLWSPSYALPHLAATLRSTSAVQAYRVDPVRSTFALRLHGVDSARSTFALESTVEPECCAVSSRISHSRKFSKDPSSARAERA